ncbi:PQQ-dependent sugar dehydrogenase [Hufsiella ginkgonis]|uniref:Glucose dehydrogenase n=1 Tax=Hufsiella ginkgonis TaxID=2695274 RepID=A0A7K1Y0P6_9SPHI|nr:PQQ-dependent sugar dehydrogenase [Hufsiella ginkgonis]MXV16813.1 glucose dehydrogenase [Hufsiella ginkgonis]
MKPKYFLGVLFVALVLESAIGNAQVPDSPLKLEVKLLTDQLTHPTAFAEPDDKSGRLFVCEQEGRIRIIKNGTLLPVPFLDITGEVIKKEGYEERGLLGLAFHPDFAKNGKFYVYCSIPVVPKVPGVDHKSVIREYAVSKDADAADKTTMKTVLTFNEPQSNHNGGDIKFGPDGFLYIAAGDGGGQNDKHGQFGNAQDLGNFLGKILRIDINQSPYGIPKDNPFAGKQGISPEIFAYGFRNPWRISFDKQTGKLFSGDVGQDNYEEVNLVTRGGNYGWRKREGLHEKYPADPDPGNWLNPITEYPHPEGISVTGGFVYRGKQIPALVGKYVFADWTGPVWTLTDTKKERWNREKLSISHAAGYWHIYSFGEDRSGEIYLLTMMLETNKGALYKIVQGK